MLAVAKNILTILVKSLNKKLRKILGEILIRTPPTTLLEVHIDIKNITFPNGHF